MGTGGMRSGAGRPAYRLTAEQARRIDVRDLARRSLLRSGASFTWSWTRGSESSGNIGVHCYADSMRLAYSADTGDGYRDASQTVRLTRTPCRYGGNRTWLECPICARRVAVLYFRRTRFACRHCQRISYASQNGSATDRVCSRYHKLAAKAEAGKPKWQRWATYERLLGRLDSASVAMNAQLGRVLVSLGFHLD